MACDLIKKNYIGFAQRKWHSIHNQQLGVGWLDLLL